MMKYKKSIGILVFIIAVLSLVVTLYAIFSNQGAGEYKYKSIFGETVSIYGKGLYQHDSVTMATQALAQDYVTLVLGIPLLLVSLNIARKGLLKGKLLLTGTLGYFLYTYTSYSFLAMYNSMFLIYILLMSASFFAFTLMMISFDIPSLPQYFKKRFPAKFIGVFLLTVSCLFTLMWLGKIIVPLLHHSQPDGLEHYTTLTIQALDLGIVVPVSFLSGFLLIKRKPFGYLLATVITMKEVTLLTALTAMIFLQIKAGIHISPAVITLVLLLNIIILYIMFIIMKNVNEVTDTIHGKVYTAGGH
ncbi:hypothetical protein [Neobacillus jeddahensis]|uniref:hypothetical protein n=1 Tax=Neobacillus jeddahensis TaxID=1461580 RepID=UPI000AD23EAA|nr:hypothetical protein [Neobacillus jeddahensis]